MLYDGVRDCFSTYYMYDGGMLRFFEPKTTTRVYGIAVTMDEVDFDTMNARLGLYFGVRLQPSIPQIHHYRGSCDSVVEIPMANPPLMKQCVFEYDYSLPTPWSRYSNCYEFYFDQPLDVNLGDSILYGIQLCGYNFHKVVVGRDTTRSQEIWTTDGAPRQEGNVYLNVQCWDRAWNYWCQTTPYFEMAGYENAYWYDCYWGGIFPIVSPRCTAPKGLRIVHSEERLDTVLWHGDPESDVFQVSLTVYPASPDLGTIYTVADTSLVLQPYETD